MCFRKQRKKVTPHVGVWIETKDRISLLMPGLVTPHVGVWIETDQEHKTATKQESHLM